MNNLSRRGLLGGLLSTAVAAPYICRDSSLLMRLRGIIMPAQGMPRLDLVYSRDTGLLMRYDMLSPHLSEAERAALAKENNVGRILWHIDANGKRFPMWQMIEPRPGEGYVAPLPSGYLI